MGADTKANTLRGSRALERCERRRGGQQLAQHDRSRHANALPLQVKLRDAVLAQGDKRDPAEISHNGVLQHHLGQSFRGIARNMIEADAASHGKGMSIVCQRPGKEFAVCVSAGHGRGQED